MTIVVALASAAAIGSALMMACRLGAAEPYDVVTYADGHSVRTYALSGARLVCREHVCVQSGTVPAPGFALLR